MLPIVVEMPRVRGHEDASGRRCHAERGLQSEDEPLLPRRLKSTEALFATASEWSKRAGKWGILALCGRGGCPYGYGDGQQRMRVGAGGHC